jgi:hypothetical protein
MISADAAVGSGRGAVPGLPGSVSVPAHQTGRVCLHASRFIVTDTLNIVRKPAGQKAFAVIPRRWAVEPTFAWLTGHRRLARDYERDPAVSEAMIRWAVINIITRRIARGGPATRQQRRTFPAAT